MQYLGCKGCTRTALEFAKLILSLHPDGDPMGMLLCVGLSFYQPTFHLFLSEVDSQINYTHLFYYYLKSVINCTIDYYACKAAQHTWLQEFILSPLCPLASLKEFGLVGDDTRSVPLLPNLATSIALSLAYTEQWDDAVWMASTALLLFPAALGCLHNSSNCSPELQSRWTCVIKNSFFSVGHDDARVFTPLQTALYRILRQRHPKLWESDRVRVLF